MRGEERAEPAAGGLGGRKRLTPVRSSGSKVFPTHGIHSPAMRRTTASHGAQKVVVNRRPRRGPDGHGSERRRSETAARSPGLPGHGCGGDRAAQPGDRARRWRSGARRSMGSDEVWPRHSMLRPRLPIIQPMAGKAPEAEAEGGLRPGGRRTARGVPGGHAAGAPGAGRPPGPHRGHLGGRHQRRGGGSRARHRVHRPPQSIWQNLDRGRVQRLVPGRGIHPGPDPDAPARERPLRRLLARTIPVASIEDLAVRFECVAASIERAAEHWFTKGPVVPAVLASAAVPGLLPPVEIGGEHFIDGGIVNSIPIGRAVHLGATEIYILHVGRLDRPPASPQRLAGRAGGLRDRPSASLRLRHGGPARGVTAHVLPTGEPKPPLR